MSGAGRRLAAPLAVLALAGGLALAVLTAAPPAAAQGPDELAERRQRMVEEQIRGRGIRQPEVLRAMAEVPRHLFVPEALREEAYEDKALPIEYGQTISQPYIVALMTELLDLSGDEKVLEIGTGSGYHSAVLARVADEVYSIEIIEPLGRRAATRLRYLGYGKVQVRIGDGYAGWPQQEPFDAIILTAAPPRLPEPLFEQLKVGGRMVVPVGEYLQDLLLIVKNRDGSRTSKRIAPVVFVPMTGEVQQKEGRP
ncbi:MAG TPA: protein-L-isoaspartate(D-aspartate) O-methyltransferase [Thermoanaerobaculia bacterium]|nr:protein-L-isoaspartate(D-aspartate) O-methyltransferase [Thermoanaerobaculia bacterium]